jgi:predicted enzyme related to lactoylglutathione lyase
MTASSPASASPGLLTIGQIAINTRDITRAVAFYRDVLGIPFMFEAPPSLAFFKCGDVSLMLGGAESPEFDHPSSVLYFNTNDIHASHTALKERGVRFRDEPHKIHAAGGRELWMTFFDDSEGNILAIQQWRVAGSA